MKKIFGILGLLVAVCLFATLASDSFSSGYNVENLIRRTALFGILGIGVAFVIITGGIDLSIGSVICLVGCGLPWLLTVRHWPLPAALLAVALVALGIGLMHGLLITRLRLQPFIVTLCGLLLYRGVARGITNDQTVGFGDGFKGLRVLATGKIAIPFVHGFEIPAPWVVLVLVAVAAAIFLNHTIYGRYLFALGCNREAADYSGINTGRMIVVAYVISAALAGLGGVLFVLDVNSAQPVDFGNFYELYAIAAAVLGGCSLRGGEGSILGVLIGTALILVLRNVITLVTNHNNIEFAIIGAVILLGVIADELVKRYAVKRRAVRALGLVKVLLLFGLILSLKAARGQSLVLTQSPFLQPGGGGREATPGVVNPPIRSAYRHTISLDGDWDFAMDPGQEGDRQEWFRPGALWPGKVVLQVPGCWEAQGVGGPGNSVPSTPERRSRPLRGAYVGTAWYRKEITLPGDSARKELWLKIGGVHAQGWFWVNGVFLHHDASYCGSFKYNITDLVGADRKVVVTAKVRNDVPSGKGLFGWMHRFGGLYRSVEIDLTPDRLVDDAYVEGSVDQRSATARVKLRSTAGQPGNVELEITVSTLDGREAGHAASKRTLEAGQSQDLALNIPLDPFESWSPEHPNLYRADIVLMAGGEPIDGWVERFGVRKWEVRGGNFYLNNQKYFVRGFGDDWVYPLTLCSPASRDYHRAHLRLARALGFGYVRHHTHCELPEFYDAADEMGIMVQPELPYYGPTPSAGATNWFRPKEDLIELITHYRRHVSLSTYCMGNEGSLGSPIAREIYQLGKRLDPTRLFLHQDGGRNTPENSDFRTGPSVLWEPGAVEGSRPFFAHEYLNLAVDADPRLAPNYTGAELPPLSPEPFQSELSRVGLPLQWGYACLDAGHQLQRIYQKRGLESARLDPVCDGYIYWTLMDVCFVGDQGLLTQFWDTKASTPQYFRQFNGPTALLAKTLPVERILAEGEELKVDWWISPFDATPVRNDTLSWKLVADGQNLLSGQLNAISAETGEVKSIGQSILKIPAMTRPVKAQLVAELEGARVKNSWDVWLFPRIAPRAGAGKGLAASERIYAALSGRYPGLVRLGTPEAAAARVILASAIDGATANALDQGKRVLLLGLEGPNPGVGLGWWAPGTQTGTALARHPAFGDFPHQGYLDELFFRLIGNAVRLSDGGYEAVDPLMVGHGTLGYLLHVFEAKAGQGKLLASGLNLLSGHPEADYLLDQFIQYVRSEQFDPHGTLDLTRARERAEALARLRQNLNGWSRTLEPRQTVSYPSFLGPMNMAVVRLTGPENLLRWHTARLPGQLRARETFTLKWLAGMGYLSQPAGRFKLLLGERALVDFEVVHQTRRWNSGDGAVELEYEVRQAGAEDTSGIMCLTLPSAWLAPGQEAELRVLPEQNGSRRWFSIYEQGVSP